MLLYDRSAQRTVTLAFFRLAVRTVGVVCVFMPGAVGQSPKLGSPDCSSLRPGVPLLKTDSERPLPEVSFQ